MNNYYVNDCLCMSDMQKLDLLYTDDCWDDLATMNAMNMCQ